MFVTRDQNRKILLEFETETEFEKKNHFDIIPWFLKKISTVCRHSIVMLLFNTDIVFSCEHLMSDVELRSE